MRKRYEADYQVVTAGSAGSALEVLGGLRDAGRQVALVLADRQLPGMTGTELLARVARLRSQVKAPRLKPGPRQPATRSKHRIRPDGMVHRLIRQGRRRRW